MTTAPKPASVYCSFCGKSAAEVHAIVAGPTVFICDECIALCFDTLIARGYSLAFKKPAPKPEPPKVEAPPIKPSDVDGLFNALRKLTKALHGYVVATKPASGESA